MAYLGIDCGLSGAIALVSDKETWVRSMPTRPLGKGNWYDPSIIFSWLKQLSESYPTLFAHVENVGLHAPSARGLASMRDGYSIVIACLEILGIPYETTMAIKWQKEFWSKPKMPKGTKFDTKAASINTAKKLFPQISLKRTEKSKKDHDGFSDALLIAEYARRKNW